MPRTTRRGTRVAPRAAAEEAVARRARGRREGAADPGVARLAPEAAPPAPARIGASGAAAGGGRRRGSAGNRGGGGGAVGVGPAGIARALSVRVMLGSRHTKVDTSAKNMNLSRL